MEQEEILVPLTDRIKEKAKKVLIEFYDPTINVEDSSYRSELDLFELALREERTDTIVECANAQLGESGALRKLKERSDKLAQILDQLHDYHYTSIVHSTLDEMVQALKSYREVADEIDKERSIEDFISEHKKLFNNLKQTSDKLAKAS